MHVAVPSAYRRRSLSSQRFVMAGSDGKQTGILGRLRSKRDMRHERRAEKARIRGVMRETDRREPGLRRAGRDVDPWLIATGRRKLEDAEVGMLARPAAQRPQQRLAAMVRPKPGKMALQDLESIRRPDTIRGCASGRR